MTGSAVQWVGEFLHLADPAQEAASLATTVPDADGVYFVPAMVGLGAPHWNAAARGTITGLSRSHSAAHLARAAVEAIGYQVADVFFAMEEACGMKFLALNADGGATRNRASCNSRQISLTAPSCFQRTKNFRPLEHRGWPASHWDGGATLGKLQLCRARSSDSLPR